MIFFSPLKFNGSPPEELVVVGRKRIRLPIGGPGNFSGAKSFPMVKPLELLLIPRPALAEAPLLANEFPVQEHLWDPWVP